MRVVIVDDEQAARKNITDFLYENYRTTVTVGGVAGSIAEAELIIPQVEPDLLLLDIDLPDGTAFDLLNLDIKPPGCRIIFVTAFNQYAIKAIRYSALDYMLKPWDSDDMKRAIDRALEPSIPVDTDAGLEVLRINGNIYNPENSDSRPLKIALKTASSIHLVKIEDIIRVESDGNYSRFHITDKKPILISRTLKEYDELLSDSGFFRVHQSHLVNLDRIATYRRNDGGSLVMTDGHEVPVSYRKKEKLNRILNSLFPG